VINLGFSILVEPFNPIATLLPKTARTRGFNKFRQAFKSLQGTGQDSTVLMS